MKRVILTILIAIAFSAFAAADPITFTLDPTSGNVKGNPGDVVGWGFTITNTTANWIELTQSEFDPTAGSDPGVGDGTNYTDFLSSPPFNFYITDPGSTISAAFDPNSMSGLGDFLINPTAQPGSNAHGNIVVTYSVFTDDPNVDPSSQVFPDQTVSAPAMVSVPESSSLSLLIGALFLPIMFAGWRRRRRGVLKESRA